jgi:hypothetical protein
MRICAYGLRVLTSLGPTEHERAIFELTSHQVPSDGHYPDSVLNPEVHSFRES